MARTPRAELTLIELVVLGLVAERPRHGYDVEAAIRKRRLRSWTPIGFSSIYHVLNKLAEAGLLGCRTCRGERVPQRVYRTNARGWSALRGRLRSIIATPSRAAHEVELAMMFAGTLGRRELLDCLAERARLTGENLREERRLHRHYLKLGCPVWTDLIFRHTIGRLAAERAWTRATSAALRRDEQRK